MKYIIVLADGMADLPLAELGGKTPMAAAKKPCMNRLAAGGKVGLCKTVQDDEEPGSDVANLAILGYQAKKYLKGRSGLEALALGIALAADDMTLRANLVTLSGEAEFGKRRLIDYAAGDIEADEAKELFELLAQEMDCEDAQIFVGNGFRGILRTKYAGECEFAAAHNMMGEKLADNKPKGIGAEAAWDYMARAAKVLEGAKVNEKRLAEGKLPANGLWLWGAGLPTELPNFGEQNGVACAMVAGASLIKGIGMAAGFKLLEVSGATGGVVTDFAGKCRAALEYLLSGGEFVFVHIEAPDEAGHQGDVAAKVRAIEQIDAQIVAGLVDGLYAAGEEFRLVVMPDHATPVAIRTHSRGLVPLLLFDSRMDVAEDGGCFDEENAQKGELGEIMAADILGLLFDR